MFEDYNVQRQTVRDGVNTDDMEFKPISEFVGQEIKVDGFFFTTKGKYGKQVVVVGNGSLINMPKRAVEVFEKIADNDTQLQAVLNGHLKLIDIKPIITKNGPSTAYKFADC